MNPLQDTDDVFDSRDFYEICQQYRWARKTKDDNFLPHKAFEALKDFCRAALAATERPDAVPLTDAEAHTALGARGYREAYDAGYRAAVLALAAPAAKLPTAREWCAIQTPEWATTTDWQKGWDAASAALAAPAVQRGCSYPDCRCDGPATDGGCAAEPAAQSAAPAVPVYRRPDKCANCLRPRAEHAGIYCPKPYTTLWSEWDYADPPGFAPAAQSAESVSADMLPSDPRMECWVLQSVELTRDTNGMCVVKVNGREVIRDNGDVIGHYATPEWLQRPAAQSAAPAVQAEPVAWWRISYVDDQGYSDADVQIGKNKPTEQIMRDNGFPWQPLYGQSLTAEEKS